eukprot:TRINITY_DN41808_c0_g2_i1.p1 TRINITY_DN41808_c0_g2~~TRINITY_DN41808_c0_g2_i1.p1  ORF type:complete len:262 (+),score=62.36 TRINITY_DN41808_c0_g2_i1:678-1463(+)
MKKPFLTAVDTIRIFLYPSLGRFDVFLYAGLSKQRSTESDFKTLCDAFTPRVPNTVNCEAAADPAREEILDAIGLKEKQYDLLQHRFYFKHEVSVYKGFLLGMWDTMKCNGMIRRAEEKGYKYVWIVRLRPDAIFFAPVPLLTTVPKSEHLIFVRDCSVAPELGGREDMFLMGLATPMMRWMERLLDLASVQRHYKYESAYGLWMLLLRGWTSEEYSKLASTFYNTSLVDLEGLYTFVYRWPSQHLAPSFWRVQQPAADST